MSADSVMEAWAGRQNWDAARQLGLLLEYVNNQQDDQCLEDFLAQAAFEEDTEDAAAAAAANEQADAEEATTPSTEDGETQYLVQYRCPDCDHGWYEVYSAPCDSTCPKCQTSNINPVSYKELPDAAE